MRLIMKYFENSYKMYLYTLKYNYFLEDNDWIIDKLFLK